MSVECLLSEGPAAAGAAAGEAGALAAASASFAPVDVFGAAAGEAAGAAESAKLRALRHVRRHAAVLVARARIILDDIWRTSKTLLTHSRCAWVRVGACGDGWSLAVEAIGFEREKKLCR